MKLYVVEGWESENWTPQYLHKNDFREVLRNAQICRSDMLTRVRRVETELEVHAYIHQGLIIWCDTPGLETEWVR